MAKRTGSTVRINTEAVQGEGSYLVMRRPTYGEQKGWAKLDFASEDSDVRFKASDTIMAALVMEWNWVDDADKPLPLPSVDQSVLDRLTDAEFAVLTRTFAAMLPNAEAQKN